jgi:hypothetical protein
VLESGARSTTCLITICGLGLNTGVVIEGLWNASVRMVLGILIRTTSGRRVTVIGFMDVMVAVDELFREVGSVSFKHDSDPYSKPLKILECQKCFSLTLNSEHRCVSETSANSELTSNDVSVSMPIGTIVFATKDARDDSLPNPHPGTICYLVDTNTFWIFTGSFPWIQTDQYFRRSA